MATPGEVITAMAQAMRVSEPTIFQHDRNLVVAGKRTVGSRGKSAPPLTPRYVARLIIATLAAERTRDSVIAVERYERSQIATETWSGCSIPELEGLPQRHSFADAVEAIILAAMSGSLKGYLEDDKPPPIDDEDCGQHTISPANSRLIVSAQMPNVLGEVAISGRVIRRPKYTLAVPDLPTHKEKWSAFDDQLAKLGLHDTGDLSHYRKITGATFLAVANVLGTGAVSDAAA